MKIGNPEGKTMAFVLAFPQPDRGVSSLCTPQMSLLSLIHFMHFTDSCAGIAERGKGRMQFHAFLCQFKSGLPNSLIPSAPLRPHPMLVPELSSPKKIDQFLEGVSLCELAPFLAKCVLEVARTGGIAPCVLRTRGSSCSWICCREYCQ